MTFLESAVFKVGSDLRIYGKIFFLFLILVFIWAQVPAQSIREIQKAAPFDRQVDARFGTSVSMWGNFAVVGALHESKDAFGSNQIYRAGAAYIFEKSNGVWQQRQKIVASDRDDTDIFGKAVSIFEDYIVVGANLNEGLSPDGQVWAGSGSAYIYQRDSNGLWPEVQKIKASDGDYGVFFGHDVYVSGNYIISGAPFEEEDETGGNEKFGSGAAYLFQKDSSGIWHEVQKLVASDREPLDLFGFSVAISGEYAIAGSPLESNDVFGDNQLDSSGSAYIFKRNGSGVWQEAKKITAPERGVEDHFGASVALMGQYSVVGSPEEDLIFGNDTVTDAGAAYIFELDSSGIWQYVQKIVSLNPMEDAGFGQSLSLSGNRLSIGYSVGYDLADTSIFQYTGGVEVFERNGDGDWKFVQKLTASDKAVNDNFGFSVASFGADIIVGAEWEDEDAEGNNTLGEAGSAYFFETCVTFSSVKLTACDSFVVPSGKDTYKISGVYIDTIQNAANCDSIITFDLEILYGSGSSRMASSCGSYTYNGKTYTNTGTYFDTLSNSSGCDSIITLQLNISEIVKTVIDTVACGAYASPSGKHLWTSSGLYNDTLISKNGCDSLLEINLTVVEGTLPPCGTGECQEMFPNIFTPNYDGINDRFEMITNCNAKEGILSIYNRWGQPLWSQTGISVSWDGYINGKPAVQGIYFYLYQRPDTQLNGSFTLLRNNGGH